MMVPVQVVDRNRIPIGREQEWVEHELVIWTIRDVFVLILTREVVVERTHFRQLLALRIFGNLALLSGTPLSKHQDGSERRGSGDAADDLCETTSPQHDENPFSDNR